LSSEVALFCAALFCLLTSSMPTPAWRFTVVVCIQTYSGNVRMASREKNASRPHGTFPTRSTAGCWFSGIYQEFPSCKYIYYYSYYS
jgi:hypothetical protein